jgi:hypothetical protein
VYAQVAAIGAKTTACLGSPQTVIRHPIGDGPFLRLLDETGRVQQQPIVYFLVV